MKLLRNRAMRALCLSTSVFGLGMATSAHAQDADGGETGNGVEVIVVTAQKVSENIQDVPIAIAAVSADRLEQTGTTSLEGLTQIVPSVTFRKGTTSANSAIVMRGVGTITFSIAAEPSVSTVVDGVVLSRSGQAFMDLVDAERIEVLRGPQGTLFGKNASAGLVNIISKGGTDTFEAEARTEWFEGDEFRARAAFSGPLAEDLSARVTGFYGSYDGNITNINGGQNEKVNGYQHYGARGILDYRGERATARFIADFFKADDDCCADVTGVSRGAALDGELGLPGGSAQGVDQRFVNHNLITQTKDTQWSLTGSLDLEVSDTHTLSVVTGYRNWKNRELRDGDFLPRAVVGTAELHDQGLVTTQQMSFEARLASDQTQPFFYQVGAFAWHSNNRQYFTRSDITCTTSTLPATTAGAIPCNTADKVNTLFPTASSQSDVNSSNFALFGQATYRFSDLIALTGGLRYTWDDLSFNHFRAPAVNATNGQPATAPGVIAAPAGGLTTSTPPGNGTNISTGSVNNGNLSGKAVLQITPSDDVMIYGSYTRGYKGPAFNVFFNHTAPNNAAPISEEVSDAFEVGLKSQFLDNRVQLNIAAFHVDYDGFQSNNFIPVGTPPVFISNLTNAGKVRSKGAEVDLVANMVDGLTLRASAAYADAKVIEFFRAPGAPPPPVANGTQLPLAPKFIYTLGGNYEADLGGLKVYLDTDYRHVSKQFSDLNEVGPINPYGIWNASLGISDSSDIYRVTFHARNITDKSYALLNIGAGQRYQIPREADRYFGVSLRARIQ